MSWQAWVWALLSAGAWFLGSAQAAPVAYTNRAAFDAAAAALPGGSVSTLNFDSMVVNGLISSGSAVGGITFGYDLGGVSLQLRNGAPTTSGSNFLGTDDGGVLQQGDSFQMSFGAVRAIGLYVMSLDSLFDDDLRLEVGSGFVSLSAANLQQTLADGTRVYFLGLVDATTAFTSASLRTDPNGFGQFLWNVDDIVTVSAPPGAGTGELPEPGTLALLGASLAGLVAASRRRSGATTAVHHL